MQGLLTNILSIDRELEFVRLELNRIGFREGPLFVLPHVYAALARTEKLHLVGLTGCHVVFDHRMVPKWRLLKVVSKGEVSLDFLYNLGFLHGLQDFGISCRAFAGPLCIQLTQARHSLGKAVYCGGSAQKWSLSSFEGGNGKASAPFNQLMQCGCQACLSCLHGAGKLPEGSIVPGDC